MNSKSFVEVLEHSGVSQAQWCMLVVPAAREAETSLSKS